MSSNAPAEQPLGTLETVATFDGPMPTGVTVSHSGRIFVNFPEWGDDVTATVAEVRDGRCVPFPDLASNSPSNDHDAGAFVSVQSVVVGPIDRLWVLDTGSPEFQPTEVGGPKLVCVDLSTDTVVQTIVPPREVALEATCLNDIRFDLRRGEAGTASSPTHPMAGPTGSSWWTWRRGRLAAAARSSVHQAGGPGDVPPADRGPAVDGTPAGRACEPIGLGSDGIAISWDGERLCYCPFASRQLWSVSVNALVDRSLEDAAVADTADGYLYVTANQLHRQAAYQGGKDLRDRPYHVFRTPIDAGPVLLRPAVGS